MSFVAGLPTASLIPKPISSAPRRAIRSASMQEYYCHRPVDKCRIDFMQRATRGNIAIFQAMAALPEEAFTLK